MIDLKTLDQGKKVSPDRILLYGVPKIGKSTFGSEATSPVFLNIEEGLDNINCTRLLKKDDERTFNLCCDAIKALMTQEHKFKTLVIDSLDWLEELIHNDVCKQFNAKNISDQSVKAFAYGKGYDYAYERWLYFLRGLDALRDSKGMEIILIAHSEIRSFKNPLDIDYDQYLPKIHKKALGKIREWVDFIFFAEEKKSVSKDSGVARVLDRVITITGNDNCVTGSRITLTDPNNNPLREIPLVYSEFNNFRNKAKSTAKSEVKNA